MWLCECPNFDEGLVKPLVTVGGYLVLMCDSGGEVWLRPKDVGVADPYYPSGPDWEVIGAISVEPGTTRWATAEDLEETDWDVDWVVAG